MVATAGDAASQRRRSGAGRRQPGGSAPSTAALTTTAAAVLILGGAVPRGAAELPLNGSYTSLSQAWPALADLDNYPNDTSIGGRNLTRCCLYAVRESYRVTPDGFIVQVDDESSRFVDRTPWQLSEDQWPCGAGYAGDDNGAPVVKIPYSWCAANCGGWQKSSSMALSQWVLPFVGFILPSVVFCLNVSVSVTSFCCRLGVLSPDHLASRRPQRRGDGAGTVNQRIPLERGEQGRSGNPAP